MPDPLPLPLRGIYLVIPAVGRVGAAISMHNYWGDFELNQQLGFTLVPPAAEEAEG